MKMKNFFFWFPLNRFMQAISGWKELQFLGVIFGNYGIGLIRVKRIKNGPY
jgi:hypothetical protein